MLMGVRGQLFWLNKTDENTILSGAAWALRAQEGTLRKFIDVFSLVDPRHNVELVALARNLFENLIWLKLFNLAPEYGLLFYRQLLESQIKSQDQAISQAELEIKIFENADKEDRPDLSHIQDMLEKNDESATNSAASIRDYMQAAEKKVDDKVRRIFSIYAHDAKHNGYGYQAYLIKNKVIPHHEEQRRINSEHKLELDSFLASIDQKKLPGIFNQRWVWATRAESVGMKTHYQLIYSYTSRLLHATPMNLITPNQLSSQERELLLNYIRVGIQDAHDSILSFQFPGQIKMQLVEISD